MRRVSISLLIAPALTFGLLSDAGAQTPSASSPATATGALPAAVSKPAEKSLPPAMDANRSPITLLDTPKRTPVMPVPTPLGVTPRGTMSPSASPSLGNVPAGSSLLGAEGQLPGGAVSGGGNVPGSTAPGGLAGLGGGALSNSPLGAGTAPLPRTPELSDVSGEGVGTPGVGTSTSPLFARAPEPVRSPPPAPVPMLPLGILYGGILLVTGGYLWYTARLAPENERNAG